MACVMNFFARETASSIARPFTRPADTAATAPVTAEGLHRPCRAARATARRSATYAPVMAAVRGHDFPVALQFQNFRD